MKSEDSQKNQRGEKHSEFIFGVHPLMEALKKGIEIEKVMVQQGTNLAQLQVLKKQLAERDIPLFYAPREKFDRITRSNHQGIISFLTPVIFQPLDEILNRVYEQGREPLFILLDRITDVRNFGAICRSAECAGADAVIIPTRGSARIGGDAVKTSAGALMHIPVCRSENLKETIRYLKDSGVCIAGITEKTDKEIFKTPLSGPICLVLGSEEDGISPEYLKACDLKLKIPLMGRTSSLNVSVASSIALYEVIRQRLNRNP